MQKLTKIRLNKEFSLGGKGWPDGIMSLFCSSEINDEKFPKLLALKKVYKIYSGKTILVRIREYHNTREIINTVEHEVGNI